MMLSVNSFSKGDLRKQIALAFSSRVFLVKILTIIFFDIYLHLSGIYDIITLYFYRTVVGVAENETFY